MSTGIKINLTKAAYPGKKLNLEGKKRPLKTGY